jgi:hypothetical protein
MVDDAVITSYAWGEVEQENPEGYFAVTTPAF